MRQPDRSGVPVDGRPVQAENLAAAQAVRESEHDGDVEAVAGDRVRGGGAPALGAARRPRVRDGRRSPAAHRRVAAWPVASTIRSGSRRRPGRADAERACPWSGSWHVVAGWGVGGACAAGEPRRSPAPPSRSARLSRSGPSAVAANVHWVGRPRCD
ncbi:hypothetical protein ACTIVE_5145 [Actinomadura verrucosospora]|uniref:Uncharacterized protein n=1 Tax=Actinomadura verrucosospora TaxID=46165 RepID=A0A7D3ZPP7_ACTVE|nr:hypothetical protein ACTIVE_5145 [Actinomadura verrucosospora]